MIGDDIEIEIVEISGGTVALGINAPKQIDVHRKEVYLAIKEDALKELNNGKRTHGG